MAAKPKPSLGDKPTEQDLRGIASAAIKAWKNLMTNLGLDDTAISTFSINNRQDEAEACFQGLLHWLQENAAVPATWETLVKALKKSNLGHIVSQTWPYLLSDSMVEQGIRRMENKRPLSQKKKVRAIVGLYFEGELFMPRNEDLEIEFAYIMGDLNVALDPQTISREERYRIQGAVGRMYTSITKRIVPQPSSDPDRDNLFAFIDEHSNPCEPFLVDVAINVLKEHEELKERFTKYKEGLKAWLEIQIANFPRTAIVLPALSSELCLAMCTSATEDQVLLAYIIELHGYLKHCLQLDCSRLLGMQKGCTIVYFSISTVDAILLADRIQSHLTEMKEILKFSLSYIVLIDHFVVDVESGAFEVLPPSVSMTQEDFHIGTKEPEGSVEALARQLPAVKLERHQTPGQLDDVDVQGKSDLLKDNIAELEPQKLRERLLDSGIATVALAGVLTERSSTSDRQKADQHDFNVQKFMKKYEGKFLDSVEEWHHSMIPGPSEREASHDVFQHIHDNGTPDMIRRLCHFMMDWSPRRDSPADHWEHSGLSADHWEHYGSPVHHSKRYGLFKTILDDLNQQLPMSTPISLPQSKSIGNKETSVTAPQETPIPDKPQDPADNP